MALPELYKDALAWAKKRKVVLAEDYYTRFLDAARQKAATVSGLTSLRQIQSVIDSLNEAVSSGTTFADWVGSLSGEAAKLPTAQLSTVFRTNVQSSYMAGIARQQARNVDNRPYFLYDAINDSRTRPAHAEMDGYIARYDDPWWQNRIPPNGFNSVLPSQRVSGNVIAGLKAFYSGPAVEVIGKSGGRFCVTAQHPVLTCEGWRDSGALRKGDQLVGYLRKEKRRAISADLNVDDSPTTVEQVFNTLGRSARGSVPRSALNLNGDFLFLNGEVEIVAADGKLVDYIQTSALQFLAEFALSLSDEAQSRSTRNGRNMPIARRYLRGRAGLFDSGHDSFLAHGDVPSFLGSPQYAEFGKPRRQSLSASFELSRALTQSCSAFVQLDGSVRKWLSEVRPRLAEHPHAFDSAYLSIGAFGNAAEAKVFIGGFEINSNAYGDILNAHPATIEIDDVIDLRSFHYEGPVYDLETESGNILAHGGVSNIHYVLSNCRCSRIALTSEQARARGYGAQPTPNAQPDAGFSSSPLDDDGMAAIRASEERTLAAVDAKLRDVYLNRRQ